MPAGKNVVRPDVVSNTLISALEKQRQTDLSAFEAILVYVSSSRTNRAV